MAMLRKKTATRTDSKGISADNLFSRIQKRAYTLYEKRGYNTGNDWSDWFEAERQVKSELGLRY